MGKLIRAVLRGLGGSNASRLLDEAKWVHGKKNVVEADRLLTATELESWVYAYFGCSPESHLSQLEQVA